MEGISTSRIMPPRWQDTSKRNWLIMSAEPLVATRHDEQPDEQLQPPRPFICTGCDEQNYAWIAKKSTMSRRRDSLSFGRHAEVAATGNRAGQVVDSHRTV